MTPQEFHKYIQQSTLRRKERDEAWRIYKASGPQAAHDFVTDHESTVTQTRMNVALRSTPAPYGVWGQEYIEQGAINQMTNASRLPVALAGALLPDAHQGYGLPIGGVLATENEVIPYAVGVDIACRMMLTVYPTTGQVLTQPENPVCQALKQALVENTIFGSGADGIHDGNIEHEILDEKNWTGTPLLRSLRLTAIRQIGTSGTGNHFVEWGELEVQDGNNPLQLAPGNYLALLSHSGSRGVGYKIADHYTRLAMAELSDLDQTVKHLAWLSLSREVGQEYWDAMQLAGAFASANHHVIHARIANAMGLQPIASVENHHNFAWREKIVVDGQERDAIVHRKGATPAGDGVLGVIPGTMADFGYVVRGKGNPKSLNSASHGGGRQMSRSSAIKTITKEEQYAYLSKRGVTLIGGGLDEAPQAYKPIQGVIQAQSDLVDILAVFQPRIVRMADATVSSFARKPVPVGIVDAEGD